MQFLFEDGLGLDGFELGLEVFEVSVGAAVRAAARVGEIACVVFDFVAFAAPITFPTAILLGLVGISVGVTGFGKVAGKVFVLISGAVSEAGMITVIMLMGASHGWFDGIELREFDVLLMRGKCWVDVVQTQEQVLAGDV